MCLDPPVYAGRNVHVYNNSTKKYSISGVVMPRPTGQALFWAQRDNLGRQLQQGPIWATLDLLKLQNHYVAPFLPFTIWNAHIFPFWLNHTGHSKFHNTLTPSACYRPRSDCLYSLVPASAGGPPLPSPFLLLLQLWYARVGKTSVCR